MSSSEISRFALVGGLSTMLGYVVFAALVFFGQHYILAMSLCYLTGYLVNFFVARLWVFQAGRQLESISTELLATLLLTVIGLGLNILLMAALTQSLVHNTYIAGAISLIVVTLWNYSARKKWVYR